MCPRHICHFLATPSMIGPSTAPAPVPPPTISTSYFPP
jgi:hypothetical protein